MRRTNEEIFDRLGALGATVESFKDDVQLMRLDIKEMQQRQIERQARVDAELQAARSVADAAKSAAENAKAVTDRVSQWQQQGKGVLTVLGVLGVTAGGAFWWGVDRILNIFGR